MKLRIVYWALGLLGAACGIATYIWQVRLGHEIWGWNSFWMLPLLTATGAICAIGIPAILVALLAGILELLDPNEHWPHN